MASLLRRPNGSGYPLSVPAVAHDDDDDDDDDGNDDDNDDHNDGHYDNGYDYA